MKDAFPLKLRPEQLRRTFDPARAPFETSHDARECVSDVLGQRRAKEALELGLAIRDMDFHVYVAGPQRTGKTYLVRSFVEKYAAEKPVPADWVYVHNFRQPEKPSCLSFPPGGGRVFAKEMEALVQNAQTKLPAIFEGEEYNRQREEIVAQFKRLRAEAFQDLDKIAREQGYVLRFEPSGIMVAPADDDGEPLPEQTIREMSDEQREELRRKSDYIQQRVAEALRVVAAHEKTVGEAMANLDRELVLHAVGHLFEELFDKYAEQRAVLVYLERVREDVVDNYKRFIKKDEPQLPFMAAAPSEPMEYRVNVFVDNSETQGAPVILETNPTYPNLFGRIERQAQFGALVTDYTMLTPGALHKANGGYLVLPIRELLAYWLPWDGLKRALRERKALIEDVMDQLGYMVTRSLQPEAIPLDLKVVLVGEAEIFQALHVHDNQFAKFFKIKAEMAEHMDWADEEEAQFISQVCRLARQRNLPPLHRTAVARLIELASELAGDRERLTLRLAEVDDVLVEAGHLARAAGRIDVMGDDVTAAVSARRRRSSMIDERLQEAITRGFINVETGGAAVGQINGLAVYSTGDYAFGKPSRITATVGLGREGVVALDRESKLSGPFHTKGVLILEGLLRSRFAADMPLSLRASLVFEQSYSMIDGDSASLAETLALLSRLAGLPLRQDLAVTGSVSQLGQVQAIGGVNQKIEGFFRVCQAQGLSGSQGVVIPAANLKNLMLHPDVVAAADEGRFHVFAVETVDQALELFTGKPAGSPGKTGKYPRGSVNYLVRKELERLLALARRLGKDEGDDKKAE